ncbi:Cof-type HAD-IIB family hydrolase [Halobacillus campisalis]|uniref:Cof-type HAD-IIB family hydrolase n=1 Tax=Halobacillus campisalis TaxID=435909 RepID=A0ABW2K569_9BACI|nr:Cof-type HAD-IIB family hydrolase [Halobacillus campisalis]
MTKQHLIALDLDGTLLTDDKQINPQTKEVVLDAMNKGHVVCIATGRPHRASIDFYKELGLNTPMVNFNGALIHHPNNKYWDALHSPLSIRTAHKIIHKCHELGVKNILAEVKDSIYLDQHDDEIMKIFQTEDNNPVTVGRLQQNLKDDPTSLLIHPEEEKIKALRKELDTQAEFIEHRKWGAPWHVIEIVRAGMNKAVGLQKIAHYYHIPKERIIAFGDEDNDLEMIDYAGVGVAMGNGIDELKKMANYVAGTNEDNGIGEFLTEYLKLNRKAM